MSRRAGKERYERADAELHPGPDLDAFMRIVTGLKASVYPGIKAMLNPGQQEVIILLLNRSKVEALRNSLKELAAPYSSSFHPQFDQLAELRDLRVKGDNMDVVCHTRRAFLPFLTFLLGRELLKHPQITAPSGNKHRDRVVQAAIDEANSTVAPSPKVPTPTFARDVRAAAAADQSTRDMDNLVCIKRGINVIPGANCFISIFNLKDATPAQDQIFVLTDKPRIVATRDYFKGLADSCKLPEIKFDRTGFDFLPKESKLEVVCYADRASVKGLTVLLATVLLAEFEELEVKKMIKAELDPNSSALERAIYTATNVIAELIWNRATGASIIPAPESERHALNARQVSEVINYIRVLNWKPERKIVETQTQARRRSASAPHAVPVSESRAAVELKDSPGTSPSPAIAAGQSAGRSPQY